ncbi:hypothetical protein L0F63_003253, partial [Massospora cicadina]
MYKLSVSVDNTQLLTLFNVKLLDPPVLYLKVLDQTAAYFSWEHSSPERHIVNHMSEQLDTYMGEFKDATLEHSLESDGSPLSIRKEFSLEEQIKRLESDKGFLQSSRENIRLEFKHLNNDEQPHFTLYKQLSDLRAELQALEETLAFNQAEVEALREQKSQLTSLRSSLEHQIDELTTLLNRTESSLKARLKEIEAEERSHAGYPAELAALEKRFRVDKNRLEQELRAINLDNQLLEANLEEHSANFKRLQDHLKDDEANYQQLLNALTAAKSEESRLGAGNHDRLKKYCQLISELGQQLSDKKELSEQLGELSAKKLTLLHSLAQLNCSRTSAEPERNALVPASASLTWMRPAESTMPTPRFETLVSQQHTVESLSTDFPWPHAQPTREHPLATSQAFFPTWPNEEEAEWPLRIVR